MEWQTIDTAPRDGTIVLLFGPWSGQISGYGNTPRIDIGYYRDGKSEFVGNDWWELITGDGYVAWMTPTHWMPLPKEPK